MTLRQFRLAGLLFCLAAAASLAGCGRRGPLETPSAAAAKDQDQTSESGAAKASQKTEQTSPIPSPFKKQSSYPLDPLL